MRSLFILLLVALCASGCYRLSSEEAEGLRAVPVTNNPHLVPQKKQSGVPAIPY